MAPVDMPPVDTTTTTQSAFVVVFSVSTGDDTASTHNSVTLNVEPLPAVDTRRLPVAPSHRVQRVGLSSEQAKPHVAAPLPRARSPPGRKAGAVFNGDGQLAERPTTRDEKLVLAPVGVLPAGAFV